MELIFILFYSISIIYAFCIGFLIYGFDKVKTFENTEIQPKTAFTIVVPFRNENANLPTLLDSFSKLNYPSHLFEVILVDDESDFRPERQPTGEAFQIEIIDNIRVSNSPKKDAINTAIAVAKNDWIITTDADCRVNENWLKILDNYIQNHQVLMIAGAVTYDCGNGFLHNFQQLDLSSLQGATIGSFGLKNAFMCNGANFGYTKTFFEELNGFEGNSNIASGDDVFLLQKAIAHSPEKVHYLKSKNTIVITKPLNDWKSLFYQRVRWAGKTGSYNSVFGKFLAIMVFAENLSWVCGFGFWVLSLYSFQNFFLFVLIKFVFDTILIYKTNRFLTATKMRYLILSSLLYPVFSVSVALYSFFGKYEWKGRKFNA